MNARFLSLLRVATNDIGKVGTVKMKGTTFKTCILWTVYLTIVTKDSILLLFLAQPSEARVKVQLWSSANERALPFAFVHRGQRYQESANCRFKQVSYLISILNIEIKDSYCSVVLWSVLKSAGKSAIEWADDAWSPANERALPFAANNIGKVRATIKRVFWWTIVCLKKYHVRFV